MTPKVWVNGWLQPADRTALGPLDRGFTLGDGLFETVRVYRGVPFRLEAHLRRLEEGLARLGIRPPGGPGLPRVRAGVAAVLRDGGKEDASLRITVSRGPGPPGLAPPTEDTPSVVVMLAPYQPQEHWYRQGLSVRITEGRVNEGGLTAGLKHLGYLESILARQQADRYGADDGILLNGRGNLAEGTASNLFLVRRNVLLTPSLREGILPGVTRATVLELAGRRGLAVWEGALPVRLLDEAQEVFLTSSLRELAPVVDVDGRPVAEGCPGPVWRGLQELYRERVARETGVPHR